MAVAMKAEAPSLRGRVSDAEWRMRIELAPAAAWWRIAA